MQDHDGELHVETDEARGATNNNIVRWILLISLVGAIVLLSIIWITGAATQSDEESNVSVSRQINEATDDANQADSTDSIVGEDADEVETAEPGDNAITAPNPNQGNADGGADADAAADTAGN